MAQPRTIAVPEALLLQLQRCMGEQLRPSDSEGAVALEELRRVCEQQQQAASPAATKSEPTDGTSERAENGPAPEIQQQWRELETQMLERIAQQAAAREAAEAACEALLRFANEHPHFPCWSAVAECVDAARWSLEMSRVLRASEAKERRFQAWRAKVRAFEDVESEKRWRLRDKSPGYHAMRYWDKTEPCDKWAGPIQVLRLEKYCDVCGLTGVERTGDCPNYKQHQKWLDVLLERYEYSECL